MANKSISMSKVRQIIKLYGQSMGKKRIAERLGMSKNTVKLYIDHFKQLKIPWPELSKLTDFELNKIFHPPKDTPFNDRLQQLYDFFPTMEKELRRRGMTIGRQYREFKALNPNGYGETAFYEYFTKWSKKVNSSMHIEHKVGDKMYVDFAGATLPYVDLETGEIKQSQVFVAILGWSQYPYVEAMKNQTIEEFITACENALLYFQGVPLAIVPDNLKSAIHKANRYEAIANENFKAFADHYGMSILAARSRKPKDKAHVENMVKLTYQNIYVSLPEKAVLPLEELNAHIRTHLAILTNTLLTGKECSRNDLWAMELSSLQPLATTAYELQKIKQVTVAKTSHVWLIEDQHHYSVPYELIGKKLRMQYSRSVVDLYLQYELVATHKRNRSPHHFTTIVSHLPPQHRFVSEWSPEFFMEKAKAIDPIVEHYISQILARKQHPEQNYKSCSGILSFAKRVGHARLINACKRGHQVGYYNYKNIDDILKSNMEQYEEESQLTPMPKHDNIRGSNYYK